LTEPPRLNGSIGGGATRKRTLALTEAASDLADRLGDYHAIGLASATSGVAAFLRGEWQLARDACSSGEQVLRDHCTGVSWEMTSAQLFMLAATFYLGDLAGLARMVPERLREAVERGNLYMATGLRSWRTNVAWLAVDDPDEARRQVDLAHRQWSHAGFHLQHYYELLSNCQIDLYTGDAATAFERITNRWAALEKSLLMRVQNLRIEALHLRARCALASGDGRGLKIAASAAADIARYRMPWGAPLAELVSATVAHRRGYRERARALLDAATESATGADMKLHAAVARYYRAKLGNNEKNAPTAEESLQEIRELGARDPERIADMLAPGFS